MISMISIRTVCVGIVIFSAGVVSVFGVLIIISALGGLRWTNQP